MDGLKTLEAVENNFHIAPMQKKLACRGSSNSETVCFKLDRYAGKTDLSECHCTIKTQNSEGKSDLAVPEVVAGDRKLSVLWTLSSGAAATAGKLLVQVQLEKTFDDSSKNINWQSNIMEFEIADSLNAADEIADREPTLFQQWEEKVNTLYSDASAEIQSMQALQSEVKADADAVAQRKQSIDQTAAQVSQNAQAAADSAQNSAAFAAAAQTSAQQAQEAVAQVQRKVDAFSGYTKGEINNGFACALSGKASGQSVTLDDVQQNTGFRSLLVTGKTVQGGTGDPSPNNVRPLYGTTALTITGGNEDSQVAALPAVLYGLPDGTSDSYDAAGGQGTQKIGKMILNGSENWLSFNVNTVRSWARLPVDAVYSESADAVPNMMCDKYPVKSPNDVYHTANAVSLNSSIVLSLTPDIQTLDSFKAKLASSPVTVLFEAAKPGAIHAESVGISAYAPNCSVSVSQGTVSVQYIRDISIAFAKIENLVRAYASVPD